MSPSFRMQALTAALLALGGCASSGFQGNSAGSRDVGTLGELEAMEISIASESLAEISTDQTLAKYREAAELFDDPERRSRALRRMADLALSSAEQQQLEDDLSARVDRMVYDRTMAQVQTSADTERRLALIGVAETMAPSVEEAGEIDYSTAIALYQELLDSTRDPAQRAEAYYLLAKAYSMDGNLEQARYSLDALVSEHPDSEWALESQFRRGELLFSEENYRLAEQAYQDVINRGTNNEFYHQARYKHGWSHYKLSDYRAAQHSFFALLDSLHGSAALDDDTSMDFKLYEDTQRSASLAFTNLGGPEAVIAWFAEQGPRSYEGDIYQSLGELYLTQQRYRDAAGAFAAFVEVYPSDNRAPAFSSLRIAAYQQGGFPTLVLPAKEDFVERYGVDSDYWQDNPQARDGYVTTLKEHILDLAQHYHALAQQSGKPDDYRQPAHWYHQYLRTPPASEQQAAIHHRYAQTLFSARDYAAAKVEFQHTGYDYPDYPQRADAAFAALVAQQRHLDSLDDEAKQAALNQEKIADGLRFTRSFASHPQVHGVYEDTIEAQLTAEDIEGAISTAGLLVNHQPPASEAQLRYGWRTIANGEFDLGRYAVAELAYQQLLTFASLGTEQVQRYSEQLGISIYRQAEQQREQGNSEQAAATFLRVGQTVPNAEVRKNAEFDAATLYLELGNNAAAIPVLEGFRQRYGDDPLAETIPDRLAIAYEQSGNYSAAADELILIAARYREEQPDLSREALWQAAEMQDRAEQPAASMAIYQQYLQLWPEPVDFRAEAQYRMLTLSRQMNDPRSEQRWLKALVDTYEEQGHNASDRIAWLGAYAYFTLAEPRFEEFKGIALRQPLRDSLARKTGVMRTALESYQAIAAIGVAEFATAANYKIGEMYRLLAHDLIHSEPPAGLDELELEEYTMLLEDRALPYEDQAIDILIVNTDLVVEDIYDQWVKNSFAALAELIPGRYAKFEQVEEYVDIIY